MTDTRRRSLERAALSSGSPDDEARVLLERLRRGDLSRERVEAAAYAGHEASRLILGNGPHDWLAALPGGGPTVLGVEAMPLERWLSGLSRWGVEAQVAAALGAALAVWREAATPGGPDAMGSAEALTVKAALDAAGGWLECPCAACEDHWIIQQSVVFNEHSQWAPLSWVPQGPWAYNEAAIRNREAPLCAVTHIGEPSVREAAAAAVRRWALDGEA